MGGYSERSDGRGYDVYIRYQTLEGKRDKRTTVKTEAEAKKRLNRWRHEIDEGILPSIEADTITVGHYLDLWLQTIRGTVSRHTYKDAYAGCRTAATNAYAPTNSTPTTRSWRDLSHVPTIVHPIRVADANPVLAFVAS